MVVDDTAFAVVAGSHAVTGMRQKPLTSVMSESAGPGLHYQPYDSDDETESVSSSDSSASGSTSSTASPATQDRRMQALDTWRVAAQQWISAPGRAPVADRVLPVRPTPVAAATKAILFSFF